MATTRRDFLVSAGALGALATISSPARGESVKAAPDVSPAIKFDSQWQSNVDSGIYPARPHLFLDDLFIESLDGVRRVMHSPKKVSDRPVLRVEKPWEGVSIKFRNSAIYDQHDRCFKCWYTVFDKKYGGVSFSRWAYATSPDGIHWEKPTLGLMEVDGSTANNLVTLGELVDSNAILMNVVRDDRDVNPARRYKGIGMDAHALQPGEIEVPYLRKTGHACAGGLYAAYSADGLRWQLRPGWLMGMFCRDGSILHGYDERFGKWLLWQRAAYLRGGRTIGVSFSDDFEHWTVPEIGLAPDKDDVPGMQFYEMSSAPSADGGVIGLIGCTGWSGQGLSADESMPQLVFARDPRAWTRVSRQPFMRQGEVGTFDEGVVIPANPITVGDEVFLFYYGKNRGKTWGEPTTDGKSVTTAALGLAKLPRDRWVSIAAEGAGGSLASKNIFFANNQLHLNVDARGGSVRVELQDGDGQPVSGYTLAECDPITIDSLDHVVTWRQGKSDFTAEIGTAKHYPPKVSRAMRVKFAIENAHLFSFSC